MSFIPLAALNNLGPLRQALGQSQWSRPFSVGDLARIEFSLETPTFEWPTEYPAKFVAEPDVCRESADWVLSQILGDES